MSVMVARVFLLGGFRLEIGHTDVSIPWLGQSVIAFVTLHPKPIPRQAISAALWPDDPPAKALARIRWVLWRLRQLDAEVIIAARGSLCLCEKVTTDLNDAIQAARRVIDHGGTVETLDIFGSDLLPDWDYDWLVVERERFRQLRLHTLETLCHKLSANGEFARAVDAGIEAIAAEPFRESAHRVLIEVHLCEGNSVEALRQVEQYELLAAELGVTPSSRLSKLAEMARTGTKPFWLETAERDI
jgi:DNA-binding SARP family transcriptional activator